MEFLKEFFKKKVNQFTKVLTPLLFTTLVFSVSQVYGTPNQLTEVKKVFLNEGFQKSKSQGFDLELKDYANSGICTVMLLGNSQSVLISERVYTLPLILSDIGALRSFLEKSKCIKPLVKVCAPYMDVENTGEELFSFSIAKALIKKKNELEYGDCSISIIKQGKFIQFNIEIKRKDLKKNLQFLNKGGN